MAIIKKLNEHFHPYPKEKSLYHLPKENPNKNTKAIKEFKKKYPKCMICELPQQTNHKKTRGAGGADAKENLWPLCFRHHTERHAIGIKSFRKKYGLEIENWERKKK